MLNSDLSIKDFLIDLGLDETEIKIFLAMLDHGALTTLKLAKITDIPRTTVYRIVENLHAKGLTEELISDRQTKAKVIDPDRLQLIIDNRHKRQKRLEEGFGEIKNIILEKTDILPFSTKVLYYRGEEGMKQMLWNLLRTKDEFRGFSYCTPVETTGLKFAVDWAIEFNDRRIQARDLFSNHYKTSIEKHPYPAAISWPTWESRYISPSLLTINHQVDIYNNVVSFYDWHDGEIFGVEIYNQKVANLQKQIFDLIWKTTEK